MRHNSITARKDLFIALKARKSLNPCYLFWYRPLRLELYSDKWSPSTPLLNFSVYAPQNVWGEGGRLEENGVRQEVKIHMVLRHKSGLFPVYNGNVDLEL